MRRSSDFQQGAKELNTRINNTTWYSRRQIQTILKSCNLPSSIEYCIILQNECVLQKQPGKFKYRFVNTPVNYAELERDARKLRVHFREYKRASSSPLAKSSNKKEVTSEEEEARAIAFLKSRGFLILKQV